MGEGYPSSQSRLSQQGGVDLQARGAQRTPSDLNSRSVAGEAFVKMANDKKDSFVDVCESLM